MAAPLVEQINYEAALADIRAESQSGGGIGNEVWLEMPELGAVGFAELVASVACPAIPDGPGQVVTATFAHGSARVLDLVFGVYGRLANGRVDSRLTHSGQPRDSPSLHSFVICCIIWLTHP